jgi:hypothetical protein
MYQLAIAPFPRFTLLLFDRCTMHLSKVLLTTRMEEPLAFPKNNKETQPPPDTAFREARCCGDAVGTDADAKLETISQPLTETLSTSKAAMAPPHAEHGCIAMSGQPIMPPIAELSWKEQF